MRRWTLSLGMVTALVACLAIGAAGSAGAATLDFTGTLTLVGWWIRIPPAPVHGSGSGAAVVNGSVGGTHLTSFVIGAGAVGPITTSVARGSYWLSTNSVRFTGIQNLTGSFAAVSGGPPGGGPMGLSGLMKICMLFAPCEYANVTVPITPVGGVGFGIGGTQTVPGVIALTLQHAPWTIGQPVMTIHTANSNVTSPVLPGGFAHGPASLTSSTAQPSGVVQLVTVSKVFTSLTSAFPEYPAISVLTLHFVPEPGTLLLLGVGVVGLAAGGRRRSLR